MFKQTLLSVNVGKAELLQMIHALHYRETLLDGRLQFEVANNVSTEETAKALGDTRRMLEIAVVAYRTVQ